MTRGKCSFRADLKIRCSADVDVELKPEGYTPLFVAVMRGKERMVRVLLECGAAADRKVAGSTAFFLGAKMGVGKPILRALLRKWCI